MPDLRCFHRPSEIEPRELRLSSDESHHLAASNRARPGDTVVAFDGRGNEWVCECVSADRAQAVLRVRFHQKLAPLPYRITLAQALPKGRTMDDIVRRATELGVAAIAPLQSERTIVRVDSGAEEHKQDKWVAAAVEAAKQCGNPWLPEIAPIRSVEQFAAESTREQDLRLIASLQPGAQPLQTVLARHRAEKGRPPARVAWMIGPEGDFTTAEMATARNHGFEPVSLGPLVLRCETAAIFAVGILAYELQAAARA
jgi:16S rRNA (uracil1498-N3)-methyltransferase